MDIVVQPAVSWMELNEEIKTTGLFFPVDPGPTVRLSDVASLRTSNNLQLGEIRRHGRNEL